MSKFTKSLIGMLVLSLSVVFPAFADENAVVGLKGNVNDLEKKVADLQKTVQQLASQPREAAPSGGYVASPSENSGGLIHTAQDINMSGYAAVQFNQNLGVQSTNPDIGTGTGPGNPFRSFDQNMDTFSVNQFDLTFSKDPNPEGGVGFKLDLLMGQDARTLSSAIGQTGASVSGVDANGNTITSTGTSSDYLTPIEAYIDVVAPMNFIGENDILGDTVDIKVGRFVTLAGAEVIRATDNWNISRGLIFQLSAPFTHTGARATYQLFNDRVTTYLGVNNGWDNLIDNNQFKTIETGFSFSPLENVNWLTALYIGPENTQTSGHKRYMMSNVLGWDATDKLSFKSEFAFGSEARVNNLVNSSGIQDWQNAQWFGWAGYTRYQLTEKWGWVYRLEFFRDPDYFRTAVENGGSTASTSLPFASASTWSMTFGTDYKLYENLTGRLEYRLDKADDDSPFNAHQSQSTIGAELIYQFA